MMSQSRSRRCDRGRRRGHANGDFDVSCLPELRSRSPRREPTVQRVRAPLLSQARCGHGDEGAGDDEGVQAVTGCRPRHQRRSPR